MHLGLTDWGLIHKLHSGITDWGLIHKLNHAITDCGLIHKNMVQSLIGDSFIDRTC